MSSKHRLGDLQLAIMKILWQKHKATVNDVHQTLLPQRGLAPTTIATMLKKMEDKGVVKHDVEGRQFIYRPAVKEEDVTRTMVGELVDRLYEGDALAMVSHLLSDRDFDESELKRLKSMIAQHDEARRGHDDR
ncbi:MAG: BlaI/MecI/CopY family transcriptional regulator [Planctomycetota bacterium]|nr:BlaI/MecI/CopY family transcriptional regulator [Planctomycetota bacterium]